MIDKLFRPACLSRELIIRTFPITIRRLTLATLSIFLLVAADAQGTISFLVRSKAFRDNQSLRVRSNDFGKTWSFTSVEQR